MKEYLTFDFEILCCKKFECECGLKFGSKQVYSRHVRLKCKLKKNIGKTTKDLLQQCDKCPSKVLSLEEHHVSKTNRGKVRAAFRASSVRIVGKFFSILLLIAQYQNINLNLSTFRTMSITKVCPSDVMPVFGGRKPKKVFKSTIHRCMETKNSCWNHARHFSSA